MQRKKPASCDAAIGGQKGAGKMTCRNRALTTFFLLASTSVLVASLCTAAAAKEIEEENLVSVKEPSTQPSQQPKQKIDPYTMAIIGMSLGCMCLASSVHWTLDHRKRIEGSIRQLDDFLANNCAVEFHIVGSKDNDPMLHMVKDIQENQCTQLREHADNKDAMVKRVSEIEAEIMRIWG
jgi:hypothetical protein